MNKLIIASLVTLLFTSPSFAGTAIVNGGGYGGNPRLGMLTYDGQATHLPSFPVTRNDLGFCYFANDYAVIRSNYTLIAYNCKLPSPTHFGLYWSGYQGSTNDAYSPENDVMFAATETLKMFHDWFMLDYNNISKLSLPLQFRLHEGGKSFIDHDNSIVLDDGIADISYPNTTQTTVSNMISSVYFRQVDINNLVSSNHPISLAFNNMTAMAVEFFATGKNTWRIGYGTDKNSDHATQYLDQPSKNCYGKEPGDACDIDTLAQYTQGMDPANASGLFSRAFYELANTKNWNTRKAYEVFLDAKVNHWENDPDFHTAACDVLDSTSEYGYNTYSVMLAFSVVGIDTRDCRPGT